MNITKQPLDWLESQYSDMCQLLETWANINSGTFNLAGLQQMTTAIGDQFKILDPQFLEYEAIPFEYFDERGEKQTHPLGNFLMLRKRPQARHRVLLTGHMDTVYEASHPFQKTSLMETDLLRGPGVTDMKGGLIVMLYGLAALERMPCSQDIGWDVFINSDEEIGSPSSAAILSHIARDYEAGFVFEPALDPQGTLAGARKGCGKFTLIARGKAAHAGRAFHEGRNAIVGLAEIIGHIHALNGKRPGVTFNVGSMRGGNAVNVVPDMATCQLDVRINCTSDEAWVLETLKGLAAIPNQAGAIIELHGYFNRKPKLMTRKSIKLYNALKNIGKELSLSLDWKPCGGCCDGNNLAAEGLSVIDSLGVRGGAIHSENEFILLRSLPERAQLLALLLQKIALGEVTL